MTDIFVFALVAFVCFKTFRYGLWTFGEKNPTGGIFVCILSTSSAALGAYLLLFGGA